MLKYYNELENEEINPKVVWFGLNLIVKTKVVYSQKRRISIHIEDVKYYL